MEIERIAVAAALRDEAAVELRDAYVASFISGSSTTTPDNNSDIDLHIVHSAEWWQMKSMVKGNYAVDLIYSPVALLGGQLDQHKRIAAQILAQAHVLDDRFGTVARLVATAREITKTPPEFAPDGLGLLARHRPLSLLKDAQDLLSEGDVQGMLYVLNAACDHAVSALIRRSVGPQDAKTRYRILRKDYPEIMKLYAAIWDCDSRSILTSAHAFLSQAYADVGGLADTFTTRRVHWRTAAGFLS